MGTRHLLALSVVLGVVAGSSRSAAAGTFSASGNINFGSIVIGGNASSTETITNNDNMHSHSVDIKMSSCSSAFQMSYSGNTGQTLSNLNISKSGSIDITVTFTPTSPGAASCTVNIYSTGSMTVQTSFTLSGKGVQPAMAMFSTMSIDFGSLRDNATAPNIANLTITNTGGAQLVVMSTSFTGSGFSVKTPPASGTINGGNSATWVLQFSPSPAGVHNGTVNFLKPDGTSWGQVALTAHSTTAVISMADVAFGTVDVGSSPSSDVTVSNTVSNADTGSLHVTSAQIGVATMATVTPITWYSFSSCGAGGLASCTFSPTIFIANGTPKPIGITCAVPSTATAGDTQNATVTFMSDTDPGGTSSANLSCVAGKGVLTADAPGIGLGFTGQHVMTTSTQTQTFNVGNSGNVSVSFYLSVSGADASSFGATVMGGCGTSASNQCTLAASGSVPVTVTFDPQAENSLSANLVVNSSGLAPQITLNGVGIDRHVDVIDPKIVATAFRNPGTAAPVIPVEIDNTGQEPLTITDIALTAGGQPTPVWSLSPAPAYPLMIDGLGSTMVMVAFAPNAAGPAPTAQLTVTSNSDPSDGPMIMLDGNGENRDVAMGPAAIELGETGAGIPIHLTVVDPMNPLTVTNNDSMNTFHIREFQVTGDPGFSVAMPNGDPFSPSDIVNGSPQTFDVVFSPPDLGDFNGTIELFLDQDTVPQAFVPVHGSALFVGAHGGGCDAGGGGGAGGAAFALGVLLVGRRRRGSGPRRHA
jgi:hypothetical protein